MRLFHFRILCGTKPIFKFLKSFLRPNPFVIKARDGVQLSGIGVSSFRIPKIEKELKKREIKLELAERIISTVEFTQDGTKVCQSSPSRD